MSTHVDHSNTSYDEQLRQRLSALIAGLHIPSLRRVHILADEQYVVLRGEVNSFYAAQVLQHAAQRGAEGRQVVNEVRVAPGRRVSATRFAGAMLLAILPTITLASGCGKAEADRVAVHPVTGQVSFQGRPAAGAFLVFHAKTDKDKFPPPTAQVDQRGNFSVGTYGHGDGAPAGEYAVTVVLRKSVEKDGEFQQGPNLMPPQYGKPDTTKLTVQIANGTNTVPIKITR